MDHVQQFLVGLRYVPGVEVEHADRSRFRQNGKQEGGVPPAPHHDVFAQ
jgi:hypothetical protein